MAINVLYEELISGIILCSFTKTIVKIDTLTHLERTAIQNIPLTLS